MNSDKNQDEMSIDNIPNLEKLTSDVLNFIQFTDKPEIKNMIKTRYGEFINIITEKYPDIPFSITKMLIDENINRDESIKRLIHIFERLNKIKNGKLNLNSEFKDFQEEISEEYLYPKFGGREEFIKKMGQSKK